MNIPKIEPAELEEFRKAMKSLFCERPVISLAKIRYLLQFTPVTHIALAVCFLFDTLGLTCFKHSQVSNFSD